MKTLGWRISALAWRSKFPGEKIYKNSPPVCNFTFSLFLQISDNDQHCRRLLLGMAATLLDATATCPFTGIMLFFLFENQFIIPQDRAIF